MAMECGKMVFKRTLERVSSSAATCTALMTVVGRKAGAASGADAG
jgi:hypothetical protein